ncbi:LapA family protein [Insolitispirillum peregrinum]|uniref:LapA family protein n=1 Tax=Insolitispirillum peregrinum TaxID=80876 RepID=UPI00362366C2
MRILSWLLGLPVALLAIVFAVVNRHAVTVDIWPLPWDVSAPLYLLVLGALAFGVILGSILTWLAGVPVRGKATRESRRANVMAYQLDQLKVENEALQKARQTALPRMES